MSFREYLEETRDKIIVKLYHWIFDYWRVKIKILAWILGLVAGFIYYGDRPSGAVFVFGYMGITALSVAIYLDFFIWRQRRERNE